VEANFGSFGFLAPDLFLQEKELSMKKQYICKGKNQAVLCNVHVLIANVGLLNKNYNPSLTP
jgi:hypothetical protein